MVKLKKKYFCKKRSLKVWFWLLPFWRSSRKKHPVYRRYCPADIGRWPYVKMAPEPNIWWCAIIVRQHWTHCGSWACVDWPRPKPIVRPMYLASVAVKRFLVSHIFGIIYYSVARVYLPSVRRRYNKICIDTVVSQIWVTSITMTCFDLVFTAKCVQCSPECLYRTLNIILSKYCKSCNNLVTWTRPGSPPDSMWLASVTSFDHTSNCHLRRPRTPHRTRPEWMPTRIFRLTSVDSTTDLRDTGNGRINQMKHECIYKIGLWIWMTLKKIAVGVLKNLSCF